MAFSKAIAAIRSSECLPTASRLSRYVEKNSEVSRYCELSSKQLKDVLMIDTSDPRCMTCKRKYAAAVFCCVTVDNSCS